MINVFLLVLIAAAVFPVLSLEKLIAVQILTSTMQSVVARGSTRCLGARRSCFVPYSPWNSQLYKKLPKCQVKQYFQTSSGAISLEHVTMNRHQHSFHSSTTVMLGAKRKKNGGKSKNVKTPTISKTTAKRLNRISAQNSELVEDDEELLLTTLFDANGETDEVSSLTNTQFASEYHAPVMPTECVEALLKQGMWAELLRAKKDRWRKKRSIAEAKRRRMGYNDDNEHSDEMNDHDIDDINDTISEITTLPTENKPRLFIDGTLGGGGHSQAILEQLGPGDILVGCDVDPEALATASNRLNKYLSTSDYILDREIGLECGWEDGRPMFIPVQSNFRDLKSVLSNVRHPVTRRLLLGDREVHPPARENDISKEEKDIEFPAGANGMLLDLGVSSHQIDTPDRGFAFMKDGPLDMRMSGNSVISSRSSSYSVTAADICNEFDEPSIISILQTFGDEPRARRIASAIVAARPLYSTTDLVHAINSVTPTFARQKRAGLIATSARVFQALRIAVNEEDGALRDVLEKVAPWVLSKSGGMMKVGENQGDDGMLVVLSYHSMEDKMTKRVMRDGSVNFLDGHRGRGGALERDIFGNTIDNNGDNIDYDGNQLPFEPVGKPQKASEQEIELNSRARSATLRVGIRK